MYLYLTTKKNYLNGCLNKTTMKKSKNGKIQISVQCLDNAKLIKEVRNYAKQRTIEELKKEEKL